MTEFTAQITWARDGAVFTDNRYSRGHSWRFDGGLVVPASASPHVVPLPYSVAENVDPEEAFVAALSSCHMLFFLSLAAGAGFVVDRYEDDASGEMARVEGRTRVTKVTLAPRVEYAGQAPSAAVEDALHHKAHEACFLANSVTTAIEIRPRRGHIAAPPAGGGSPVPVTSPWALVVIDVQRGFDDPKWGRRNNPGAEAAIAGLIAHWRARGQPVVHVLHDSTEPASPLHPGADGNRPKPEAEPAAGEPVHRKTVNSGFIGTSLESDLRSMGVGVLVMAGLTTNHCVSTTARMAGNLGFRTFVVSDATATFDRLGLDGAIRPAEQVHAAALSDLQGEFAAIVDAAGARALLDGVSGAEPAD
jgi:nicotinamidase-related amidase/organic hydroperoxide reductase OsmC/OhrA